MDEMQIIGYAVTVIITLGAFIAVIQKFTQPINELRIAIQKLIDNIEAMKSNDQDRDKRLDKHDEQIGELDHKVGTLETKMEMYHKGQ